MVDDDQFELSESYIGVLGQTKNLDQATARLVQVSISRVNSEVVSEFRRATHRAIPVYERITRRRAIPKTPIPKAESARPSVLGSGTEEAADTVTCI